MRHSLLLTKSMSCQILKAAPRAAVKYSSWGTALPSENVPTKTHMVTCSAAELTNDKLPCTTVLYTHVNSNRSNRGNRPLCTFQVWIPRPHEPVWLRTKQPTHTCRILRRRKGLFQRLLSRNFVFHISWPDPAWHCTYTTMIQKIKMFKMHEATSGAAFHRSGLNH